MKKLAVVISSTLALASINANANFYLGGKVGKSWLDDACTSITANCDDDSISAGVLGGYEFMDYLSLEAGYDYLGEFTADGLADEKVKAFTIAPKLNLPLTEGALLYGKFGGARVDYGSKNDNSFLGAVGLELESYKNVTVRLEYQRLTDVNNDLVKAAVNSASLGLVYKFGGSDEPAAQPVQEELMVEEVVEEEVVVEPIVKTFETKVVDSSSFALNSAELKPESKAMLAELVAFMTEFPQSTVEVVGYTDSSGAASYNQKLSERRAQSVADALEEQGIDASRISARGEGENNPIASNETQQGREQNRRVEIMVPAFEYEAQ
ncbi:OmpA family protein [Vibrio coralliilyticus]|uniref:Membrane protein n=1 Tax=Vibrio coralliilyticus TaxID=190893 RepID=A0AAN0SD11_9VIBR|nr:OmpA family protein [Vibrio coralliilyticus]AIW19606.1 membrane protein [Vibrio coralliilyticus]NOH37886.1 OmpA family protein [Vibrio coralliilyticus]